MNQPRVRTAPSDRVLLACALALVMAVSGCAEPPSDFVTVRDSAGVTIVENHAAGLESVSSWSVSGEPRIEIGGGAEPEIPLYRVTAVTPLESGRVAIGMTTPPQVVVVEADGGLSATLGQPGEGPGEFLTVGSVVALHADSVMVWDPDRRRFAVFQEDGTLVREVDLGAVAPMSARASANTQTASGFTHLLPLADGTLAVVAEAALGPESEGMIVRHELPAFRIDPVGEVLASYGTFPGLASSPGMAAPFGARTHPAGGSHLVVGTSESPEYRMYGNSGDLTQIVRWPDSDRTIAGPFLERWLEMVEADPNLGGFIEAAPRPERYPAYDDIVTTDRDEVLVGAYPGPLGLMPLRRADQVPEAFKGKLRVPAREWLVFTSDGTVNATFTTPEGFEPYALRGDDLWGVYTDELDVESVRAYTLTRS